MKKIISYTTALFLGILLSSGSCNTDAFDLEQEVKINGVTWADRNVDTKGNFAAKPESFGKFYQWNRDTPWNTSGSVTGWPNTTSGITWESINDPCPVGYRVPSKADFEKLIAATNFKWTKVGGVRGGLFTDINTGKSIFLPAAGNRFYDGSLIDVGVAIRYWSSTKSSGGDAYLLNHTEDLSLTIMSQAGARGCSVRCVKM